MLISSNFVFKVCDFGMGRKMDDGSDGGADGEDGASEYYRSGNAKMFPLRWTAPEAFTDSKYSQATDVWSWAVLAYEVFSLGQRPYSDWTDKEVWVKVNDGERLARPTDFCTEATWDRFILPWWVGLACAVQSVFLREVAPPGSWHPPLSVLVPHAHSA